MLNQLSILSILSFKLCNLYSLLSLIQGKFYVKAVFLLVNSFLWHQVMFINCDEPQGLKCSSTPLSEHKWRTCHLPHRHFPCHEYCEKFSLGEGTTSVAAIRPGSPPPLISLFTADSTLPTLLIYFASKFVQKVMS